MSSKSVTIDAEPLARTPLYDLHIELGARIVPFAGYEMPVRFAGVIEEHRRVRNAAGLFDVSHMGQLRLRGAGAAAALETLVPMDVIGLAEGRQRYALFTGEDGGILDDFMVANAGDHLFLVVNAACTARDLAHLRDNLGDRCEVEDLADRALLALQGPAAATVMSTVAPQAVEMPFMTGAALDILGVSCFVTRSGYTGEDGFEISLPAEAAERTARQLLAREVVAPIGLGARDTLRLEAGLCLHGQDIDETTTPVQAGLAWAIQKVRRRGGAREFGFPGAEIVDAELRAGPARRRVGLRAEGRVPVRAGAELTDEAGTVVGRVTSGGFGPTVEAPVAMGYVISEHATVGARLNTMVRGKAVAVAVARMPFVAHRYHRG